MINTRMTSEEILKEFRKDKEETIRSRSLGLVKANRKYIMSGQKKTDWVMIKRVQRIVTPRNNNYRSCVKGRYVKDTPGYMSTIYMILTEWGGSGKKVVYLMPAEDTDKGLITFSPTFFHEFNERRGLKFSDFTEAVDNFMKTEKKFDLYVKDTGNPRYNCQVDLGSGMVGFGTYSEGKAIFHVRHYSELDDIEKLREEKKLETKDPITIWLSSRIIEEETLTPEPKNNKESEIDAAWKEFERLCKGVPEDEG